MDSIERIFWQSFPRATAVAEAGWSLQANRDYDNFIKRLEEFMSRLKTLGVIGAPAECYSYDGRGKMFKLVTSKEPVALQEYRKYR